MSKVKMGMPPIPLLIIHTELPGDTWYPSRSLTAIHQMLLICSKEQFRRFSTTFAPPHPEPVVSFASDSFIFSEFRFLAQYKQEGHIMGNKAWQHPRIRDSSQTSVFFKNPQLCLSVQLHYLYMCPINLAFGEDIYCTLSRCNPELPDPMNLYP